MLETAISDRGTVLGNIPHILAITNGPELIFIARIARSIPGPSLCRMLLHTVVPKVACQRIWTSNSCNFNRGVF